MTPEQRESVLSLKPHLDRLNRTGTLDMSDSDYQKLQTLHLELRGQKFDGMCRSCIANALKSLINDAG